MNHFPLKGGCAVGTHSVSPPFATLNATADEISISFSAGSYSFPSKTIECVSHFPGLHMQGVEIVHKSDSLPRPVIFWTFQPEQTREALRQLGYTVNNPE